MQLIELLFMLNISCTSSASYLLCVNLSTQLRMLYYDFIQMHELHIALSTYGPCMHSLMHRLVSTTDNYVSYSVYIQLYLDRIGVYTVY